MYLKWINSEKVMINYILYWINQTMIITENQCHYPDYNNGCFRSTGRGLEPEGKTDRVPPIYRDERQSQNADGDRDSLKKKKHYYSLVHATFSI